MRRAAERADIRRLRRRNLHDRELVAAQPRHQVLAAHATAHAVGRRLQQQVADRMSERIVDALEAVEIETENRDGSQSAAEWLSTVSIRS